MRPLRLLIAEDFEPDADLLIAEVVRAGFAPEATVVQTLPDFVRALEQAPDIVLCDYTMPTMTAPDALAVLAEMAPQVPLIVVSGTMDESICVLSLQLGAVDYLLKDRLSRLGPAVEHALARAEMDRAARAAEAKRQQTANIMLGLVENGTAAIGVRDLLGGILIANPTYQRLYDVTASMTAPDPLVKIRQEERFDVEGEQRTFLSVRFPILDHTDEVFAVGNIMMDLTERQRMEDDLRAARVELQARAEHLDAANAELRELDRLKSEFVASVSHELRTPLTSIRGYAELLSDEVEAGSRQASMLDVVDRNAQRLLSLVEDLLMLSRNDSGGRGHHVGDVDLAEVVQAARVVLQPVADAAGISLRVRLDGELPVAGDRSQLERVMLNLLSNAVKFSHALDVVTVEGTLADGEVVVIVRDTGIGVSAQELPKLFTRFFRSADDEAHSIPGTGLGLAVVREILQNHDGTVGMESVLGLGSTVTVRLPSRP